MRIPRKGLPDEDAPVSLAKIAARWRERQWHVKWKLTDARIPIFRASPPPVESIRMGDLLRYEATVRATQEAAK